MKSPVPCSSLEASTRDADESVYKTSASSASMRIEIKKMAATLRNLQVVESSLKISKPRTMNTGTKT